MNQLEDEAATELDGRSTGSREDESVTTRLESIEGELQEMKISAAERRPVEDLLKIFIYFLVALSVVVGLFGLRQFSDLRDLVAAEVQLQFPRDQQNYLEYERMIAAARDLDRDFQDLFGKYSVALENFSELDRVKDDFDIEGKVLRVIEESDARSSDGGPGVMDEEWRLGAISILHLLADAQETRSFDSDFIFNAAQAASRLQQSELANELMTKAYEKRPGDEPIRAGMLSGIVNLGTEEEVEQAFGELMDMVAELTDNSPHIVLSEAWNAAEERRRYFELVGAIDRMLARESGPKPSQAYLLKAQALLRASRPDAVASAKSAMEEGLAVLKTESTFSLWFETSLKTLAQLDESFGRSEALRDFLRTRHSVSAALATGSPLLEIPANR